MRKTHRKCVDYDEDHSNAGTVQQVFSGRAPSEITSAPRAKEPDLVGKLVKRGEGLPSDHPAAPLLPLLAEQAAASDRSRAAWTDAAKQQALADTAVDIARLNVVRVYNDNIIDIRRASGEEIAELCFPTLRRPVPTDDEDESPAPGTPPTS